VKVNDSESIECNEPVDIESVRRTTEPGTGETLEDNLLQLADGGLPYEPVPEVKAIADPDEQEQAGIRRELFDFFLFGNRREGLDTSTDIISVVPALLYQYRDLKNIRHDYPFCLEGTESSAAVQSLSNIVDDLAESVNDEGEIGKRLKHHIHRIEPEIRELVYQSRTAGLLGLWDRAAKNLLAKSQLSRKKKDLLRDNLAITRRSLTDSEMISCGPHTAQQLLTGLARIHWRERSGSIRQELDSVLQQLSDLLSIDFNSSGEGQKPEYLRQATATDDEIDFNAMSSLLKASHLDHQLPEGRINRIQASLDILQNARPLFEGEPVVPGTRQEGHFEIGNLFDNTAAAIQAYDTRMEMIVDFFKAMAIAKLEIENRYQEDVHDDYFERFDVKYLDEHELTFYPPVLINIRCSEIVEEDLNTLMTLLTSRLPVKLLLQVDDLFTRETTSERSDITINWPARLAGMAMATANAYVMQAPVSHLQALQKGFLDGLSFHGPALFSVYVGKEEYRSGLPVYFDAGAAMEARVFPLFSFDPAKGRTLIERLDVLGNSQSDQDWSSDTFSYHNAEDDKATLELQFTPADFLLNNRLFVDQFWRLEQDYRHDDLMPLQVYLKLQTEDSENKIPYILAVDEDACIHRIVVTRNIVELVRDCADSWHQLREFGGVRNSFVIKQLEEEKIRLEAEKVKEVATIEEEYRLQMERDVGKLTEQIVQRIASQLLLRGEAPVIAFDQPPPGAPAHAAAERAEAAAEPAAQVEDEEDEEDEGIVAFDAPYIDTPLCTSCDDCTTLNPRLFAYDDNKQAIIKDPDAGSFKDLVIAAEICPVKVIHPGKPRSPDEPGLDELIERAAPFN
jgi:ferredoxin